jgi:hypothetical protein
LKSAGTLMLKYNIGESIIKDMLTSPIKYRFTFKDEYITNKDGKVSPQNMGENIAYYKTDKNGHKEVVKSDIVISIKAIHDREKRKELPETVFLAGVIAHEYTHSLDENINLDKSERESDADSHMDELLNQIRKESYAW